MVLVLSRRDELVLCSPCLVLLETRSQAVQDCAVPLLQLNFARKKKIKSVITILKIPFLARSQIPASKANEVENKSQRAS